ncbi:MAG: beta-eliminating lyase-related protein [Planctomycetes bacterium]|nr:beta-eliminating lyase-related protein [Planctomycetota bacterium]
MKPREQERTDEGFPYGENAAMLPSAGVRWDLLSDSLQHHARALARFERSPVEPEADGETCETLARELFGFPHNIVLGQGRQAEALLARLLVRPGYAVPANLAFPTTRLHQELCGGCSVCVAGAQAFEPEESSAFKSDVDLDLLREALRGQVAYVCIECSANGAGGHPIRLENLRAVRALASERGVPVVLDATRIFENALRIRDAEPGTKGRSVHAIVRELCGLADAMTLSLTKDFPTRVGGLVALRDETLYQHGLDFELASGSGLTLGGRAEIAAALRHASRDLAYIERRMALVRRLHARLAAEGLPVANPPGAHAVWIRVDAWVPHLRVEEFPVEAVNAALHERFGLRGSPQPAFAREPSAAASLLRLALPVATFNEAEVDAMAECLIEFHRIRASIPGLRVVHAPAVPGGPFRATYARCGAAETVAL